LNTLQTQTWPDVRNNIKDYSSDHITYFQLSDVQILWSSHHLFHLEVLFSVIRGLTIAAPPRTLDLWSSYRAVFVETGSSSWISSSVVAFAAVVLIFTDNPLQCTAIPYTYFWFSATIPFCVFPWSVYAITTLKTLLWIHWIKWPFLVVVASAKHTPTICPF